MYSFSINYIKKSISLTILILDKKKLIVCLIYSLRISYNFHNFYMRFYKNSSIGILQ